MEHYGRVFLEHIIAKLKKKGYVRIVQWNLFLLWTLFSESSEMVLNYYCIVYILKYNIVLVKYRSKLPSQIHTLLSLLQVASKLPVHAHDVPFTSFSWPSKVAKHSNSPDFLLHTLVVASKLAAARNWPQGDHDTDLIVLVWASAKTDLHNHLSPSRWNV